MKLHYEEDEIRIGERSLIIYLIDNLDYII